MRMFQTILKNIIKFFCMYIGQGSKISISVFSIVIIFFTIRYKRLNGEFKITRKIFSHSFICALFSMYIYFVVGITFLSRRENYSPDLNFQVMNIFDNSYYERMFVYENILLFIPLSILLFILAKPFRKFQYSILTGVMCSVIIEIMQLITHRGKFELEDIIANSLGMMFGFLLCSLGKQIYKKISG